ncbi:MAG: hypothetical protein V7L23_15375 [Nostoc sp.]|uniref:hypothetical protein n=1 Tax=Nostoc sp. TaxID=1180 RepID=UPI002FF09C79
MQQQPNPQLNNSQPIIFHVKEDLDARYRQGLIVYGKPLQQNNGRDMLQDLYEEILDAAMYVKGEILERAGDYPDW